jgi:hypothetical protein
VIVRKRGIAVGCSPAEVEIAMAVALDLEPLAAARILPRFAPAAR